MNFFQIIKKLTNYQINKLSNFTNDETVHKSSINGNRYHSLLVSNIYTN